MVRTIEGRDLISAPKIKTVLNSELRIQLGFFEDHVRLYEENGEWKMDLLGLKAPHPQVLPYLTNYTELKPGVTMDYRDFTNQTGHGQRGFIVRVALMAFLESDGMPFIDVGSAGVKTFGGISSDIHKNGEKDNYNGVVNDVCISTDAANLSIFQDNNLSAVVGNHIGEHIKCFQLRGGESWQEKRTIACPGLELLNVLERQWLRVVRPGGYVAMVIPDEEHARQCGTSIFEADTEHQHAWSADEFYRNILRPLIDANLCTIEEFDTLDNHFSFNFCLRTR